MYYSSILKIIIMIDSIIPGNKKWFYIRKKGLSLIVIHFTSLLGNIIFINVEKVFHKI